MFDEIFTEIEAWMRSIFTSMIHSNLDRMFTDINDKTGQIAAQVGQTPQGWNSNIFTMIQNLSNTVIVPIAGLIITFVLCYELITMITEKNNMHDLDTWMFFRYFVKMWIAVYLVSNTWTITMAVFDVGQNLVNQAAGVITGMMGEISSWNSSSGAVRSPSAEDWMDMPGMRTKPAPADSRAAHTDEV